jgi:hypothetical protein
MMYSGTFSITTSVGTLSGTVVGQINNAVVSTVPPASVAPVTATLSLKATSGTGQFKRTKGTLNVSLQFPTLGSLGFVGSVTAK